MAARGRCAFLKSVVQQKREEGGGGSEKEERIAEVRAKFNIGANARQGPI